ncbi:MAG: histidine phosphatase family protein, partial [Oscillospiraceae bacterium]|nr:histidine phosphatase family protein [Oscillospiraceae bacterium]
MKLLIIRHGDPDYTIDSLTEKGHREAAMLSERIAPLDIAAYYVSPLGRAQVTADYTLKKCNRTAETLDWLHEFDRNLILGSDGKRRIAWDMLPEIWTAVSAYYDKDKWIDVPVMSEADMKNGITYVQNGLDALLAKHGYV